MHLPHFIPVTPRRVITLIVLFGVFLAISVGLYLSDMGERKGTGERLKIMAKLRLRSLAKDAYCVDGKVAVDVTPENRKW